MSTPGSTLMGCPDVQAELNAYFNECDAATRGFPSPFNEFMWSDMNRSGLQQQINPAEGKLRTVILRYDQGLAPAPIASASADLSCVSTTKRGDLSKSYTIDPDVVVMQEELMNTDDWFDTCRTNPEIILRKIALLMKSVREGTYKKTADEFVNGAMWGEWGVFAKSSYNVIAQDLVVKTKKDGTDDIFPTTMQQIKNAINMTGYCAPAFITGGNALYEYWQLMQSGCCSNQGIDLAAIFNQFGMAVTWDKYLQQSSAFNDVDQSVAIQPKSLQLVYFNRFASNATTDAALNIRAGKNYDKFVINDPVSGMPMNIMISDNCGDISIQIHTCTQLVALPYDIYGAGDDLAGVTYVNKILVTNV
jgi:hypothetical protein